MRTKNLYLFLPILFILVFSMTAQSQTRAGGGFAWGSEIEDFGLNLRGDFFVTDNISLVPGFTYFFTESNLTWWELSADGHWNFQGEAAGAYALFGLNFTHISVTVPIFGTVSDTEVGLNLGGGYNFSLPGPVDPFAEGKFVVGNADQLVIAFGILVTIN